MIGKKVTHLRENKGLSMRMLAQKANIAYSTLMLLEKGRSNPSAKVLQKLSHFFNVDPEYWVRDENNVRIVNDATLKALQKAKDLKKTDVEPLPEKQVETVVEQRPVLVEEKPKELCKQNTKSMIDRQIAIREGIIAILKKEIESKDQLLNEFKNMIDELLEEFSKR